MNLSMISAFFSMTFTGIFSGVLIPERSILKANFAKYLQNLNIAIIFFHETFFT